MSVPVNLEIFMTDLTRAGLASIGKNVNDAEGQTRQLIAALEEVRAEYQRVLEANRRAGQSYTQELANVQALTGQINGLKEGLKELEAAKQQTNATPVVDADAVTRQTSNLKMQFQQVARELPSLAMGPQMFILAISNNLPMLADAIADVRKQNELLKASGQKSVPVWKQLGGALLSWQTALVAGISLLIVYGDEVVSWVKSLFKAKGSLAEMEEALQQVNDSTGRTYATIHREIGELDELKERLGRATQGTSEWKAVKDKIVADYSRYLPSLEEEIEKTGTLAGSYNRLAESIRTAAAAKGYADLKASEDKKYGETLVGTFQDVRNKLVDAYGDEDGRSFFEGWKNWLTRLEAGEEIPAEVQEAYSNVSVGFNQTLNSLLFRLDNQRKAREEALEKFREIFDLGDEDLYADTTGNTSSGQSGDTVSRKDYAAELAEARLRAQQKVERLRLQLMKDGVEKRRALARQEYDEAIAGIDREEQQTKAKMDAARKQGDLVTDGEYADVSQNAQQQRILQLAVLNGKLQAIEQDYRDKNIQAEIEYNKQYGSTLEKREAITRQYNRKIAEARGTDTWEGKLAQKQQEEALAGLDLEELKKSINWELIFGDLSKVSKKELDKVKGQLEDFRESAEYRKMSVDQKQVVDEAIANVKSAMIENGGLLANLPDQLSELREAQEELTEAQNKYNEALKNGSEAEKENALGKRNSAQNKLAVAQRNVSTASDRAIRNITTLGSAIAELGSASEMSMSDMGNMVQNVASLFGELGNKVGGIIGAAMSLIGTIQEQGLENFLTNMGKMGNDLARETSEFFTFGLIDFGGDSDENLEADIERLTASNQELENAIRNLADKMDEAAVAEASGVYEQQRGNLLEQMRNTQEMMERSAGAYSNGFLGMGGTHSSAHEIDSGMSAADWQAISDVVGRTIDSAGDFFNLTSEEMWRVANEATTEYARLKDLADNGYKDAAQFMDEYIGYWQELEELQEAYNEKLTSTTFDTIKDDFRNALLDMEDSTEAFAENFENMMQKAILESMMTGTYDKALKEWYQDFADSMADGIMDTDEQELLRKQWQSIVDQASEEWKNWRDLMDWDSGNAAGTSQSPQSGVLTTMSQDSISTFEGIGRSLQTHVISLDKVAQELRDQNRADSESLMQIVQNTSYLLPIYELMEKMDRDGIKIQ